MKLFGAGLCALAIGLFAPPAEAQRYFPMYDTYAWQYESASSTWEVTEEGSTTVNGLAVRKRRNVLSDSRDWWNYWSQDKAGNTFLHGYRAVIGGDGVYYDPPILWLPADPILGSDFGTIFDIYDIETGVLEETGIDVRYEIVGMEEIVVPLGTFQALRVDWVEFLPPKLSEEQSRDVLGRPVSAAVMADVLESYWYVFDMGQIQYAQVGMETLALAWFGYVLAVPQTSWGNLKAQFGD